MSLKNAFHVAANISCRRENDFMSPQKFHVAETWFHVAEKISCRREKWFHVRKMISCRQKLFHVAKNVFHVAKSGFHVAENNFMPERRSTFRMYVLLCAATSCAPKRCWSLVGTPPSREVCWHPVGPSVVALPHAHTGTPSDARVWLALPLHARCVSVPWDCLLWPYPNHTMTSWTTPEFGRQEERLWPLLASFTILNKPESGEHERVMSHKVMSYIIEG